MQVMKFGLIGYRLDMGFFNCLIAHYQLACDCRVIIFLAMTNDQCPMTNDQPSILNKNPKAQSLQKPRY